MDKYKKIILIAISIIIVISAAVFVFLFLNRKKPMIEVLPNISAKKSENENSGKEKKVEDVEPVLVIGKINKINENSIEFSSPEVDNGEKFNIPIVSEFNSVFKKEQIEPSKSSIVLRKIELSSVPLNEDIEIEFVYSSNDSYKLSKIIIP